MPQSLETPPEKIALPLSGAIETLLFITDRPLSLKRLGELCKEKNRTAIESAIGELGTRLEAQGSSLRILEIAGGFQMATKTEYSAFVRKLFADKMTLKLSRAAHETLSIVAYRQPLTRAEIETIRGVDVIAALETLLEKKLIRVAGRKETMGRPLTYETTPDFLRHFGLKSLSDLPPMENFEIPEPPASTEMGSARPTAPAAPLENQANAPLTQEATPE